jgi:hypothetical protein
MVLSAGGEVGTVLELQDHAAKKGSGRSIPAARRVAEGANDRATVVHRSRTRHPVRTRWRHDASEHRYLVWSGLHRTRFRQLLVSFWSTHIYNACCTVGA